VLGGSLGDGAQRVFHFLGSLFNGQHCAALRCLPIGGTAVMRSIRRQGRLIFHVVDHDTVILLDHPFYLFPKSVSLLFW
jgi:hypothetical protein